MVGLPLSRFPAVFPSDCVACMLAGWVFPLAYFVVGHHDVAGVHEPARIALVALALLVKTAEGLGVSFVGGFGHLPVFDIGGAAELNLL